MMAVSNFLKRSQSVELFKELREQRDNRFTLLELLDSQFIEAVCTTNSYILTLSQSLHLKCWSARSSKLQNSVRLNYTSTRNDQFSLLAENNSAILISSCYAGSRFFVWNFMDKDTQMLDVVVYIDSIVLKSAMNSEIIVTYSNNYEIAFWKLTDHSELQQVGTLAKKNVTEMEISPVSNHLYFANSKTLSLVADVAEPCREKDTGDRIFSLHVVRLPSTIVVLTGHKHHLIKLWMKNIMLLKEVYLMEGPRTQTPTSWLYRIHYLAERDELIISHNAHLTLLKIGPGKVLHQELHAHRSEITAIACYEGDPAYLVTLCESAVRLWRNTDQGPALVGELAVANVDLVVPVAGVGLYLAGKCYNAGFVVWRDTNAFLTSQLQASRTFTQSTG